MASVTILEEGRAGRVRYTDGEHVIEGYWEFGGGEVVAIVSVGSRGEWVDLHPWAVEKRPGILRFIADELLRQRAPSCKAEIDERSGDIVLLKADGAAPSVRSATPTPQQKSVAFVRRYTKLKAMVGIGILLITLIVIGTHWIGKKALKVTAAHGIPLNECVRTDKHIASLIRTTDPHALDISGRGGNTTASVSILLIPLDGSDPQVVPVADGLNSNSLDLARILGSDGHTLWSDAAGLYGVRLEDHRLITPEDLRKANPSLDHSWWEDPRGMDIVEGRLYVMRIDRSAAITVDPATLKATDTKVDPVHRRFGTRTVAEHLAAGLITAPNTWLGLLSTEELAGDHKVGRYIKAVENADDAKQPRRLCAAELEPSSDGKYLKILRITPVSDTGYLNAAFLRTASEAEAFRLEDPNGVLMVHTSAPGQQGTLVVSRVDMAGRLLWSTDTGLDRAGLEQILPGADAFAFVGTRPRVDGKLSEPLVVLVDNHSGKMSGHSLWR